MLSLFLLCREPLPHRKEGWRLNAGPVRIEPEPPGSPSLIELCEATGVQASQVLRFSCPTFSAALVAEGMAELLGRATRGVVVDDATLGVLEDYAEETPLRASELDAELSERIGELERNQEREANDWSDVEIPPGD